MSNLLTLEGEPVDREWMGEGEKGLMEGAEAAEGERSV